MEIHQVTRLHEWIEMGKQTGKIRETRTVVLAYCMDEHTVLPLIADIVKGGISEERALDFLERVIDFGSEGSGGPHSLS